MGFYQPSSNLLKIIMGLNKMKPLHQKITIEVVRRAAEMANEKQRELLAKQ